MSEANEGLGAEETIHLVATSGYPNYGDEFITASWLRFLARVRPDAEVILDCPSPGLATWLFEGLHPNLKTTDMIWRVMFETMDLSDDEADAEIDRMVNELGTPRFDFGLLAVRRASVVHFLGGGHFADHWPRHPRLLRVAVRMREITGAKLYATGLGLVPNSNPSLGDYLSQFDYASVRDQASGDATGAQVGVDDAFLALADLPGFANRGRPAEDAADGDVYVCLQSDLVPPEVFQANLAHVRTLLEGPLAGRTVKYVEALPGSDRFAFNLLVDLIGEENFIPFVKLWSEPFPAQAGQVWLTTRFHLHLLAASCGASGVALEASTDYYRTKHISLQALGTGWTRSEVGASEVPVPAFSVDFRIKSMRRHKDKLAEAEALYPRV
ncbi:MAG: polysaccharide pyruvyl transferase family protein [Nocardioides sp.]